MRCLAILLSALLATTCGCGPKPAASLDVPAVGAAGQQVNSKYPVAIDAQKIGTYPAQTKSGGGYFYDDVLEYRVWFSPPGGGGDRFEPFATFEQAEQFAQKTQGADPPLVLVRQLECIDEPTTGNYVHLKGERLTEWLPEWLAGAKRAPDSIARFLANPRRPASAESP